MTKQHLTQRRTEFINRSSSKDSQFLLATYILSFLYVCAGQDAQVPLVTKRSSGELSVFFPAIKLMSSDFVCMPEWSI